MTPSSSNATVNGKSSNQKKPFPGYTGRIYILPGTVECTRTRPTREELQAMHER